MKKKKFTHHQTREVLLVKFFFIVAVSVTASIAYGVLWFMWHTADVSYVPVVQEIIPPPPISAEDEKYFRVEVPPSHNISLCGINLMVPEFSIDSFNRLTGDFWNLSGFCGYTSGPFSIMVLDKDTVATTSPDSAQVQAFTAFDRYVASQNPKEIINIASTDTDFTTMFLRYYYSRIGKNTLTYTGEIGQDYPGMGAYQTATYLDNRYIVYLTYHLFNNHGDPWDLYFNKNFKPSEMGGNNKELFKTYVDRIVARPEVKTLIDEMGASTKTITVAE